MGLSEFRQGNFDQLPDEIKEDVKNYIGYLIERKKNENVPKSVERITEREKAFPGRIGESHQ